ncbi:MAG: hypothetical protein H7Y59_02975 [Anaerolineales bacterium]|nr:hypothetical protein [Anaerolineales bacterium]
MINQNISNQQYKIRLSAFSDSGELGYHLSRIEPLLSVNKTRKIEIVLNASSWAYDWDYASDWDPERDIYLPPSLPLPSLVEVSRFIYALSSLSDTQINIQLILPPQNHAATRFIEKTRLFSLIKSPNLSYSTNPTEPTHQQGCDDVLIPLTFIGSNTDGQLTAEFHSNFDRLADAGYFEKEHRSAIRRVIMEAAENADNWGGGGWVCCFLRQEKRGTSSSFGNIEDNFIPAQHTHLFLHVFSIKSGLARAMGQENEWDATDLITNGISARQTSGGRGFPSIINTVINSALGTVSISSGKYNRIITPDGLKREYHSAGTDYLPGVHLCAVMPLAIISNIEEALRVQV